MKHLPEQYDPTPIEARWASAWHDQNTYAWSPQRPRHETFVVDTPPPTVSGSLHVGHVFSYVQADTIARYRRMRGLNVFYPIGWDDNGLPTERRAQNVYNVRVDIHAPPGDLGGEPAAAEGPPRHVARTDFIRLCERLTRDDEAAFEALFRRIALSVDWSTKYTTIGRRARRVAQLSFLDLYEKGCVYSAFAPTTWDVDFQTTIAQAEIEDRARPGMFYELGFTIEGSSRELAVATTRPELLPACVALAIHPGDERYLGLAGKRALTPLFGAPVPIFTSELVDPDKGSGAVMVCTFGDATDVRWWREQGLPLRQVLGRDGRLLPITFGTDAFSSVDPEQANRTYAPLAGKTVKQARALIVEALPTRSPPKPTERSVKFFEKGDQPLEIIPTRQWFVSLVERKRELLAAGDRIAWSPPSMGERFRQWTEGLQLDWAISRQRFFGVPFPVWYRLDDAGQPDFEHPLLADRAALPIDPTVDTPPGFSPDQRDRPKGFTAEADVFDTWFTSSMTPQIASGWGDDPDRHARLFPGDLRPQSHEIIRTWAFYTIAKSLLHEGTEPWKQVAISGWVLDPDRKKMAKSRGNVVTPLALIDEHGADAIRYWAASARLGTDTAFDPKTFKVGRRLATKLFHAARFVLTQPAEPGPITEPLDRAFVRALSSVIDDATDAFERYDYAGALDRTERFFWSVFTDAYLELVKARARGDGAYPEAQRSAVGALRLGLSVLLRLFAPALPFITEELWSWAFAGPGDAVSIHRSPWPTSAELARALFENDTATPDARSPENGTTTPDARSPENGAAALDARSPENGTAELEARSPEYDTTTLDAARSALAAVYRAKARQNASAGRVIEGLELAAHPATLASLAPAVGDLMAAARASSWGLVERPDAAPGAFEVVTLVVR